ncbi:MAG: MXAN_2562 family outer membrane beta-barrel protein [Myxococcota bacterium]
MIALLLALHAAPIHAEDEPASYGIEVRFGPFAPAISSDETVQDFYGLIYNQDPNDSLFEFRPLMKTFEFDYYVFSDFGLLGLIGSIGHWSIDGPTRVCPDAEDGFTCTPETVFDSEPGNDESRLTLVPLTAGLVYRLDAFKRGAPYIPFVPYVKGGLSYTLWWSRTSNGTSSREGLEGRGGNLGYFGTVGLALNLDWIEPSTSQKARIGSDIADTFLFFDATIFQADGFSSDRLDFSDTFFQAGLAVDFF